MFDQECTALCCDFDKFVQCFRLFIVSTWLKRELKIAVSYAKDCEYLPKVIRSTKYALVRFLFINVVRVSLCLSASSIPPCALCVSLKKSS